MPEKHYTVQQVAEMLQVTDRTIRNWIKDGTLRAIQVKREYRIPASALEELQRSGELETAPVSASY